MYTPIARTVRTNMPTSVQTMMPTIAPVESPSSDFSLVVGGETVGPGVCGGVVNNLVGVIDITITARK